MHAYLIVAHNDFDMLSILLKSLDDERNDIYLHIDKNSKFNCKEMISNSVCKSNLFFIKRRRMSWGGML